MFLMLQGKYWVVATWNFYFFVFVVCWKRGHAAQWAGDLCIIIRIITVPALSLILLTKFGRLSRIQKMNQVYTQQTKNTYNVLTTEALKKWKFSSFVELVAVYCLAGGRDGKFLAEGELCAIGKDTLHEQFLSHPSSLSSKLWVGSRPICLDPPLLHGIIIPPQTTLPQICPCTWRRPNGMYEESV